MLNAEPMHEWCRAELLPKELAHKWTDFMEELATKVDPAKRERDFLFLHGWLAGLVDASVISYSARDELRKRLIQLACSQPTKRSSRQRPKA